MKVFVTVGSEKFPFDRFLRIIDQSVRGHIISGETFIQTGHSRYLPRFCEWKSFLGFSEMVNLVKESEIVLAHAGVGSTLLCLNLGKIPLLFPRQSRFGEQIDNHQLDFARKMEEQAKVLAAYDKRELIYKVCHYQSLISSLPKYPAFSGKTNLLMHLKKIL